MNIINKLSSVLLISSIPAALLYTENVIPRKRDIALAMLKKVATAGPDFIYDYKTGQAASKELPELKTKIDALNSDIATKATEIAVFQEKNRNTDTRIENAVLHATADAQRAHAKLEQQLTAAQRQAAEDAAKLDKAVKVAVFTGVVSTIYVAKSVYDWARPETPDEKAWREYAKSQTESKNQAARLASTFMKTESGFRVCIIDHARKAKRADGIPVICGAKADEYAKSLSDTEWSKIKTDYNEYIRG